MISASKFLMSITHIAEPKFKKLPIKTVVIYDYSIQKKTSLSTKNRLPINDFNRLQKLFRALSNLS